MLIYNKSNKDKEKMPAMPASLSLLTRTLIRSLIIVLKFLHYDRHFEHHRDHLAYP